MVPKAGFGLTVLPGRGFARKLSARGMVDNAGAAWGLSRAVARATALVRRRRPSVVVAVGGYAGVPCGLAAVAARVPLVVVEQNAVPGSANRLLGRFARACAVSFPGTDLPRSVVTGNPVRPEILGADRSAGGTGRGPGRPRPARGAAGGRRHRWVAGRAADQPGRAGRGRAVGGPDRPRRPPRGGRPRLGSGRGRAADAPPDGTGLVYQPVRYEDRMELLLAAADVLVCRAGGNTVAEVAVVGVPAVLVPLPNAPGDHQTANARALADAGGGRARARRGARRRPAGGRGGEAAGRRRPAGGDGRGRGRGRAPRRGRPGGGHRRGARPPMTDSLGRRRGQRSTSASPGASTSSASAGRG